MSELETLIRNKQARIAVVGIGYVGLPLALSFAEAGFRVLGFDVQQKRVDMANRGESYIADIGSDALAKVVVEGRLEATTDQTRLGEADVILICVPTPLGKTKDPDLSYVTYESRQIAQNLRGGQIVVLESTTYPGTTRELVLSILESSGKKAGSDFYLAYSPERVDPGNAHYGIKNTPKLVGGLDEESTRLAACVYQQVVNDVRVVSSPEIAEMAKVFENTFRSVNVALVNEMARLCERMGISVWEVIAAAATKPHGFMPFYPGPGLGGHCIPSDPYYLASKARELDFHTRFIELAAEINEAMPYHVLSRVMACLSARRKSLYGSDILVIGVTYKKDVEDIRESPALRVIQLLKEQGASVEYHDPYAPQITVAGLPMRSVELTGERLARSDCVVITTDHTCLDFSVIADKAGLVLDTRGATMGLTAPSIVRLGEP